MTRSGRSCEAIVSSVLGSISRSSTLAAETQVVISRPRRSKAIVMPHEPIPPAPSNDWENIRIGPPSGPDRR
jgi:hypothetical protein